MAISIGMPGVDPEKINVDNKIESVNKKYGKQDRKR